ncbi:MAG: electron transfer flavoprotein subunit beta/FixA family protein [Planctomycetaceae bacterium]|jgi:electron transfer flavoprotein beta subunit|nr:electron transfer flavoprotein subunit beta/FixA family protein [Planctomycetaceae bacterium]
MKILVTCKRVPDTDQKIRVKEDGSGIDDSNLAYVLNPFDAIAVEEALRICEEDKSGDEIQVVAVGVGVIDYEAELRTALAMGADRAILVENPTIMDPWTVANTIAAVVARESPDLVLMGKQAVDDDANQTGQFLAALLQWPQATFASKIRFGGLGLQVARETDQGIEEIEVPLPAVVTADLRLNEPRYASLPSILKARKKEIEIISYADLQIAVTTQLEVLSMKSEISQRSCVMLEDVTSLTEIISP